MKTRTNCGLAILLVVLGLGIAPARAAVDAFIKFDGVEGETLDIAQRGSSDVSAWVWGMDFPSASDAATSARVNFHALTMRKRFDKSTPILMNACASGAHYTRATLTLRKRSDTAVEFAHIVMEDVNVAGILIGMARDGDSTSETLSLNFARVGVEYFTILANGNAGERTEFAWNIPENVSGGVTFAGPVTLDTDGDGLPDDWERRYGLNPNVNDADLDSDQDGATNLEEYLAGTNPMDANHVFKSTLRIGTDSQTATLTWLSAAGKNYRVLVSDELGTPFQTLNTVPSAGDGTTTLIVPANSIKGFLRVEVVP